MNEGPAALDGSRDRGDDSFALFDAAELERADVAQRRPSRRPAPATSRGSDVPEPPGFDERLAACSVRGDVPRTDRALTVVGSRVTDLYQAAVVSVAVDAAARCGAALWVRLSPSGTEAAAVGLAVQAGVPVAAVCASDLGVLPAKIVDEVLATGGAVISTWDRSNADRSPAARDQLVAAATSTLLAVDGSPVDTPDTIAVISAAVERGAALVVARPRVGHRRSPHGRLAMCAADPRRVSRLGLSAAASAKLARSDPPAHAVCDGPDELAAALEFYLRWFATPRTAAG